MLAIFPATAKPPTLNHRQIFRIYGILCEDVTVLIAELIAGGTNGGFNDFWTEGMVKGKQANEVTDVTGGWISWGYW